jgi:putative transposase
VQDNEGRFSLCALCRAMRVSRSGYYVWRKRLPSKRQQQEAQLLEQIRTAHQQSDGTYGSPRVWRELREQGGVCSRNRVARLMRKYGITHSRPSVSP